MKVSIIYILFLSVLTSCQPKGDKDTDKVRHEKWLNTTLFHQALSDSGLVNKEVSLVKLIIPAGGTDTIPHAHACELIGYVLEGEVITKMKDIPAKRLQDGDVFYEYPNQVHESIQNPGNKPASLLLYYLYTNGAALYHPMNH